MGRAWFLCCLLALGAASQFHLDTTNTQSSDYESTTLSSVEYHYSGIYTDSVEKTSSTADLVTVKYSEKVTPTELTSGSGEEIVIQTQDSDQDGRYNSVANYIINTFSSSNNNNNDNNSVIINEQSKDFHTLSESRDVLRYFSYDLSLLQLATEHIEEGLCKNQTTAYLKGLRNLSSWALKMLDSSAKLSSGLLQGNIRHLGDFDECVSIRAHEDLQGQYCLATLQVSPLGKTWEHLLNTSTAGRRFLELPPGNEVSLLLPVFSLVEWALCVPASCDANDVQIGFNAALQRLTSGSGLELEAVVFPSACQTNAPTDFDAADYAMMSLFLITVILVLVASVYSYLLKKKQMASACNPGFLGCVLKAFSLSDNWSRLTNTTPSSGAIQCLDAIRFFSILWVLVHHKLLLIAKEPAINKAIMMEEVKHIGNMPFLNSVLGVDSFLLVSGLLRSYNMLHELDLNRFNPVKSFLQRYFRLTPAYAVMVGFYATLLVYIGSGPAWNKYITSNSEWCQENWMANLLYVNNYISIERMCILQSWYLSADMQLFLLAPLAIYPLWRWPRIGKVILGSLVIVSVMLPIVTIYINRFPGLYSSGGKDSTTVNYTKYVYFVTHNRMSPYLLGIALGYTLHTLRDVQYKLTRVWVLLGWATSITLTTTVVFGAYNLMQMNHPYSMVESIMYGGFHHIAWAAAVAWIVFACHKGFGGYVNSFLSANMFQPLGRLTYCIYLTHLVVLLFDVGKQRAPIFVNPYIMMHELLGDIVILLVPTVFLYLFYELPFLTISKLIFGKQS